MHEFKEQQVYDAIKFGFKNFKILARASLAKKWEKYSTSQRYAACRSLVYMESVAQNPQKYFARAHTQYLWNLRAEIYAVNNGMEDKFDAFYIVQSPSDLVNNNSQSALVSHDLAQFFYLYCNAILNWEYDRTNSHNYICENAYKFSEKIISDTKRLEQMAKIAQANVWVRPFLKIKNSFQR